MPFAIYRFASGSVLVGFIETAIILSVVGVTVYAWRSGKTRVASRLLATFAMAGCVVVTLVLGRPALPWMYVTILAAFLMLRHGEAAFLTLAALAAVAIHGGAFDSRLETATFLVTAIVVALFALIFAYRAEQLRGQLHALATRDALTGIANRRSMEEEIPLAIETARRNDRPCGLAIIDLDHFKRINDRHGHAAGDRCLVEFVGLLKSVTRKGDRLFRYGGEEFVMLLPGADAAALQVILGNLRSRISTSLQCSDETVTSSIGAAELDQDERPETWLDRADIALYQAKNGGRNRVVVWDSSLGAPAGAAADAGSRSRPRPVRHYSNS